MSKQTSPLVAGNYPSEQLTISAGVAIFHLATARVVLCYHTGEKYWFLPKGRKNTNEEITRAAEREGYEESGYRNRVLPIPFKHRQTQPDEGPQPFATEALWMQLMPLASTVQYTLFWFVAETLPPLDEKAYEDGGAEESTNGQATNPGFFSPRKPYQPPPKFPADTTLQQRMVADVTIESDGSRTVYEPVRHEGTGVDDDERQYISQLMPIAEAQQKLRGSVMADVIRRGWEAIQLRMEMEGSAPLAT